QEEVRSTRHPARAIRREPAGRQDTMQMGMMVQLLAPRVEHGEAADLCPEMLRVPSDLLECLRHRAKEQTIEVVGVLQRQRPKVVRQGKNHMTVCGSEEFLLSGGEPRRLGRAMTFGTAAVPTRVVGLDFVSAVVALRDMATEGGRPTYSDGPQGAMLLPR